MQIEVDWREHAARWLEHRPRRYASPGDLARALEPRTRTSPALDLIDDELVALADTDRADGLAIFMSPQEGKSEKVSRRFPEWLLEHNPALRIAIVSYEKEMSVRWGRQILRDLRHADPRVMDVRVLADSSAAGRWDTVQSGGLYCTGVGGALTGRPVDVLLLDDVVKDRAAAESQVLRESTWNWWESVGIPRLAPGGRVCLIMTRWHEDDLAGRILSRPGPLRWRVLSIPAIAGDDDPLGRDPGEEFPSVRGRAPGYFYRLRATMTPYVFSGIYQQSPVAAEGNFFRRASFRYWRGVVGQPDPGAVLASGALAGAWIECEGRRIDLTDPGVWKFATADVAASTRTAADWTVVCVWSIDREGDLILLDLARAQVEMGDHFAMVKPLRQRWQFDLLYIEKSFFSRTMVLDARAAGVPVAEVQADTDKISRAVPAAGRLHAGRVWFPAQAPWLEDFENELAAFPQGTHDDQVDAMAYAARIAAAHWTPAAPPSRPIKAPPELAAIERAHSAATGNGHGQPDLMQIPLGLGWQVWLMGTCGSSPATTPSRRPPPVRGRWRMCCGRTGAGGTTGWTCWCTPGATGSSGSGRRWPGWGISGSRRSPLSIRCMPGSGRRISGGRVRITWPGSGSRVTGSTPGTRGDGFHLFFTGGPVGCPGCGRTRAGSGARLCARTPPGTGFPPVMVPACGPPH